MRKLHYWSKKKRFLNLVLRRLGEWRCEYCQIICHATELKGVPKNQMVTIDHHIPQNRNPKKLFLDLSNWRICCYQCNQVRNNIDVQQDYSKKIEIAKRYMNTKKIILDSIFFEYIF